ncbi:phage baseplate assembly protein [Chelatococcus daeguensis]|uniref:Bacteriophage Mu Gp45 protein n=1 Tax=Chelatococcus sambhunathii TaxID=363953 RepID=A0ABP2A9D5_9HYPH|nr:MULTISPECIES: phage baseplate assembly protein V [Chelatococcus]KZE34096.1 hypothetical protein AVW15_17430 [Chelatococcus daeguensis]MBM3082653.1 phage baseplate assembly protein [Chelatococcus daeguensis]CUA91253.1 Bacteriophage Mu Gp45 protein [Chelatococcus sambhunathii]
MHDEVATMLRRVRLLETDDTGTQQTMRLRGLRGETLSGVVRAQYYGLSSVPPAGAEGVLLTLGGRTDRAMVLGVEAPGVRPTGMQPGETALYGPDGTILKLLMQKVYLDAQGKDVEITNARKVTIRGSNEVVIGVADRFTRIRPHRIDLAVTAEDQEAPYRVATEAGPSNVVFARLD